MTQELSRLQILGLWIELEKSYTTMLIKNANYMNFLELNKQMLLTSMFLTKNKEMISAIREVEDINSLLLIIFSPLESEKLLLRRNELSDLIMSHITPPEYFPYSFEEILLYIEKIENHQKLLNIPY